MLESGYKKDKTWDQDIVTLWSVFKYGMMFEYEFSRIRQVVIVETEGIKI